MIRRELALPALVVVLLLALAACTQASPAPMPTPTPTIPGDPVVTCTARPQGPPCGPGAELGKLYPFALYTHCGVRSAYFDGRRWIADPVLSDESGNPPPGWGNPSERGTMVLVKEDLARFTSTSGNTAEFRPLPEGEDYPWGPCS